MTIDWDLYDHIGDRSDKFRKVFFRALEKMSNLQYLALGSIGGDIPSVWTEQLFQALHSALNLNRFLL